MWCSHLKSQQATERDIRRWAFYTACPTELQVLLSWFPQSLGFPGSSVGKESTCKAGDPQFHSWVEKISWRRDRLPSPVFFPCGSAGKESACNVGDLGLIPGLGRSPGEGIGYPFQYSALENSMDCIVYGIAESQTQSTDIPFHFPQTLEQGLDSLEWYVCAQSCPTLFSGIIDCSPPGSSVHEIFQARILEWAAISSSKGSFRPRDWTLISYGSCIGRRILPTEPPGKHTLEYWFLNFLVSELFCVLKKYWRLYRALFMNIISNI